MSPSEALPTTALILCRSCTSNYSIDTVSELHFQLQHRYCVGVNTPKRLRHLVSEKLAQGPYMAARVGFEPTTLRTEGTESHHCPLILIYHHSPV